MVQNYTNSSLQVRNTGTTGDWDLAAISFICSGYYGIQLGLRADGYFGLGGWSAVAWRWYSDNAGGMVAAGNIGAYSDSLTSRMIARLSRTLSTSSIS